jgi:hypothetical protein
MLRALNAGAASEVKGLLMHAFVQRLVQFIVHAIAVDIEALEPGSLERCKHIDYGKVPLPVGESGRFGPARVSIVMHHFHS